MHLFDFIKSKRELKLKEHSSLVLEVENLSNIAKAGDSDINQIKNLLLSYPVIIIRGKGPCSEKEQIRFTAKLGELDGPFVYSTLNPSDTKVQKKWPNAKLSGLQWHSDRSYAKCPPYLSIFQMIKNPIKGNETLFVNLLEAYSALSPEIIEKWKNYSITYSADNVKHPLLWAHPFNGKKSIYFDFRFAREIIDTSLPDGTVQLVTANELIETLNTTFSKVTIYKHEWRKGDIIIIDNYAAAHKANITGHCEKSGHRVLFRTSTKGIYF